ncbi:unnamed protein product [Caenorhabditis brenneri]
MTTTISEEEEADVYRKRKETILEIFSVYWIRFMKTLPAFTGQIVVLFCVLPVSFSLAIFLLTAVFNFGIALIAQTISTVIILLFLIPSIVMCVASAIATAYILQLTQNVYLRLSTSPSSSSDAYSNHRSISPPPEYIPKMEIEEKLKTC